MNKKKKATTYSKQTKSTTQNGYSLHYDTAQSGVWTAKCHRTTLQTQTPNQNSWNLLRPDVELKHANVRVDMTLQRHFTFAASAEDTKTKHSFHDSPYQRRV